MPVKGKRIRRTRLIHSDRYVVAVDVEMVIPDEDRSEPCYEPPAIEFLRQVEEHLDRGDVEWLRQHGRVYAALDAA